MTTKAAPIKSGTVDSDSWKACALHWKLVRKDGGSSSSRSAFWIASVAVPSEPPGARLKVMVTAGNWPWWEMESGRVLCVVHDAKAASGTCSPEIGDLI